MSKNDVVLKVNEKLEKMAGKVVKDSYCCFLFGETEIPQSLKDECIKNNMPDEN